MNKEYDIANAHRKGFIKAGNKNRTSTESTLNDIKVNESAVKRISEEMIKGHGNMVEYVNIKEDMISFESEFLNQEVENFIKKNGGNGYHRVVALVNGLKEQGATDIEIANSIKKLNI